MSKNTENKETIAETAEEMAQNEVNLNTEATAQEGEAQEAEAVEILSPLEEENEKLKQEAGELKEKYLRLFAEFDNFKKRTSRERIELYKTAGQEVIVDMLPIIDDFERAFKADEKVSAEDDDGFALIYKKLVKNLGNKGLQKMKAKGEVFDVELHEAITEIPVPDEDQKGNVFDVLEEGYTLNDKIIRYPKVVVGK